MLPVMFLQVGKTISYRCFVCAKWHRRHSKTGELHWAASNKRMYAEPELTCLDDMELKRRLQVSTK